MTILSRPLILSIEKTLCHLFPSSWLAAQAREVGMIQRQRKVDPVALFWTLVLGFGIGRQRNIASLRRAYEGATGTLLSASSFYDRFTGPLMVLMSQACDRALQPLLASGPQISDALSAFRDILIRDATVLRLHDLLKKNLSGLSYQPYPSGSQTPSGTVGLWQKCAANPTHQRAAARFPGMDYRRLGKRPVAVV